MLLCFSTDTFPVNKQTKMHMQWRRQQHTATISCHSLYEVAPHVGNQSNYCLVVIPVNRIQTDLLQTMKFFKISIRFYWLIASLIRFKSSFVHVEMPEMVNSPTNLMHFLNSSTFEMFGYDRSQLTQKGVFLLHEHHGTGGDVKLFIFWGLKAHIFRQVKKKKKPSKTPDSLFFVVSPLQLVNREVGVNICSGKLQKWSRKKSLSNRCVAWEWKRERQREGEGERMGVWEGGGFQNYSTTGWDEHEYTDLLSLDGVDQQCEDPKTTGYNKWTFPLWQRDMQPC